jgi:hypothetical protein
MIFSDTAPDYVNMWHELVGETRKYRAAFRNLQKNTVLENKTVIKIENEIRAFHQMYQRTVERHKESMITV